MRLFNRLFRSSGNENGHPSVEIVKGTQIVLPEFNLNDLVVEPGSIDRTQSLTAMTVHLSKLSNVTDGKEGGFAEVLGKTAENLEETAENKKIIENKLAILIASYIKSNSLLRSRMDMNTNQQVEVNVPADSLPIAATIDLVETGTNGEIRFPYEVAITRNSIGHLLTIKYVGSSRGTQLTGEGTGIKEEDAHWEDSMPAPKTGYF